MKTRRAWRTTVRLCCLLFPGRIRDYYCLNVTDQLTPHRTLSTGHLGASEGWQHRLCHCLSVTVIRTCAVLIAVFICVCDNLPYGGCVG